MPISHWAKRAAVDGAFEPHPATPKPFTLLIPDAAIAELRHIHGHTTDFSQRAESLEVNHAPANEVGPNDDFGLKVVDHAREHDVVYKVRATR